jgi:hypothetical protein
MQSPYAPSQPFFMPLNKKYLTEEELDRTVNVLKIMVSGQYTLRGEHRKEVIENHYDAEIEVPEGYNLGHVKLGINRYIRKELHGIRARTFAVDHDIEPVLLPHKRRVRDFMSDKGLRDNERLKREYAREKLQRKQEAEMIAAGHAPSELIDDSQYGADGLPKFSERTYVA